MTTKIFTKDPATGDLVTLPELAKRHPAVTKAALYWRHQQGKRGWDLVAGPSSASARGRRIKAGLKVVEYRKGRMTESDAHRRALANEVLSTRMGQLIARPLTTRSTGEQA